MSDANTCTRELHKKLNNFQHEVVHQGAGQFLVSACAGSGKTTTLIDRIEQLILDGANPADIGVFTFAKDAANELQKRLKAIDLKEVTASTLHSLCYSILREDGAHLGGDFMIDDKSLVFYQTKDFIGRMFRGSGLDVAVADALFGLAKAFCLSAHPINQDQDKEQIIELFKKVGDKPWLADAYYNLFKEVEAWKVYKRLIDYSDQLYLAWLLLVDNADIQDKWADKFKYLLIDEGQDSSTVQNAIGLILSKKHNNIMIVGDALQSLYKWRGANPEEFINFSKKFTTYKLPVNYRSTKEICTAATSLTKDLHWNITGETLAHALAPTNPESLLATEYENPDDEANAIAEEILRLHASGIEYKDTAVLYRLVSLLAPIENALAQRKIPYVVWSGYTFYDRKEVKDVLSYLYTIAMRDPTEHWVKRAINVPFRYISKQFIQTVEDVASANKYSFIDALSAYKSPRENQNTSVRKFVDLLFRMNKMYSERQTPSEILNAMMKETFYLRTLSQEEGSEGPDPDSGKSTHVHQLIKIAQGFKTVDALLDYVSNTEMLLKESRKRRNSNAVVLSTIHRSKGLQWDVVFAPGWNEGLLPHLRNPSQDEELRIAYVCLTRAAKLFRCSWTRNQITQGGARQLPMSKFIERAGLPTVKLPTKGTPQRIDVVQWLKEHPEFADGNV